MPAPADKLAAILTEALNQWVKDNPGLFNVNVTESGGEGGGGGGGGGADPISLVMGLGLIALAANPEVGAIVEALKTGAGNAGQTAEGFGSGYFLGYAAWQFAEPYMRYVTHFIENEAQSQIHDPATAADMTARGVIGHDFGASEAGGGGFDAQHFNQMAEAALRYPGVPEALRLWNLGYMDENEVDLVLKRAGIPDAYAPKMKQLRRQYLSVADLALGNLRGDISDTDAQAYAQQLGMTAEDFQRFVYNTGEPLGLMQLLEAFRRDDIDQARLQKGVRQSRVRDEWFDVVLALRYFRMSAADAVNATVQNHLTKDEGLAAAKIAGLHPDDFPVLLETAGEPLSRTEMTELVNRHEATVEQYAQAMRESRLKDKYIPLAEKLLVKLIPYRTINTIISHGVRDQKWGIEYLMKLGYTEDDASALISTSASSKTAHIKRLTEAQIIDLYEAHAIKEEDAIKQLGDIGYAEPEARFLLEYAVAKRALSEQSKAISFLRTGYLNHRIDAQQASTAMDRLGVPPDQRDKLLTDWKIERESQVKVLTEGQIAAAVKYDIVRFDDAQAKLVEMGYSDNDAKILLSTELHGPPKGVTIGPIS